MTTIGERWWRDLGAGEPLMTGKLFWAAVALVVPFGWVFLLFRLKPVRVWSQTWLQRSSS